MSNRAPLPAPILGAFKDYYHVGETHLTVPVNQLNNVLHDYEARIASLTAALHKVANEPDAPLFIRELASDALAKGG